MRDAPTDHDIVMLVENARGWLLLAIVLAAYAGLRMGEIRALEVRDVDLDSGLLFVRRALSEGEVTTPKSGHERVVPLAPYLRPLLEKAVHGKARGTRLILTSTGSTPTRQLVLTRLKDLEARLQMRVWSFHSLRHYFCSALLRGGANAEVVRVLAGHSDLAMTQRYVHVNAGDLTAALACFSLKTGNGPVTPASPVS